MTTKYLSGYYSGYAFTSPTTNATVTATGDVGGGGVFAPVGTYTLVNLGGISGSNTGVYFQGGGLVTNGGDTATSQRITGAAEGVRIKGQGTVANWGAILDYDNGRFVAPAVYLMGGGEVTNGSGLDTGALIRGAYGVFDINTAASVFNYGSIVATGAFGSPGVGLDAGGLLVNGSGDDTTALVVGGDGFKSEVVAATVINFGSIAGLNLQFGVDMYVGGIVVNGSAADTHARISGANAVYIGGVAGTVTNFGAIDSTSGQLGGYGVKLAVGGRIANGSGADHSALISGYEDGVSLLGSALVTNYGTIQGLGNDGGALGARMNGGGSLVNGAGSDPGAVIEGYNGVLVSQSAAQVRNLGSIVGWGGTAGFGVELYKTGTLVNGTANDLTAFIAGYVGVRLEGAATASNFGAIVGTGAAGGQGVYLAGSAARFTNGSAAAAGASVSGYEGVGVAGADTVTNFGTIRGADGVAVDFTASGGDLVVEAGSSFIGSVVGGDGELELGGGMGTLAGLLGASGAVTVSGSMATTTFSDFGTVRIDAGASFTLPSGSIVAGKSFIVAGTATTAATLTSAGVITVTGTLGGAGTLSITAGTANFNGAPNLSIAKVAQSGGTASFGGAAVTVADVWTQTAGVITVPTGDKVSFTGAGDTFSGTLAGAGTIAFTGGSDLISKATIDATAVTVNGAAVTLSGAIVNASAVSVTSPDLTVAVAGVSLSGGGSINLGNLATNAVMGASAAATLTNVNNKITGAGQLGDGVMTLVNDAGGTVNGNVSTTLVINTGANTITNAGLIENVGAGGTTIVSAVNNTGTLFVSAGTLTASAAVSGAGIVKIAGGTADFGSTFTQNVTFTSTTGVLELAKATAYTGQVTGFSKTGTTALDLLNIAFGGTTTAKFSGTASSGTLTVTDGTHTAKITLEGNYTASTFTVASDGHGGTTVVDPTAAPTGRTPPVLPLVTAMAGFGGRGGGATVLPGAGARLASILLARPA